MQTITNYWTFLPFSALKFYGTFFKELQLLSGPSEIPHPFQQAHKKTHWTHRKSSKNLFFDPKPTRPLSDKLDFQPCLISFITKFSNKFLKFKANQGEELNVQIFFI